MDGWTDKRIDGSTWLCGSVALRLYGSTALRGSPRLLKLRWVRRGRYSSQLQLRYSSEKIVSLLVYLIVDFASLGNWFDGFFRFPGAS